jgi:hypothetical protein
MIINLLYIVNMNRRRYLNYISTLNTLQDNSINFKRLIPTAVYSNSIPHNNKNLIGDININITLPSGFVAQNTEAPVDRSIRQEPVSQVFEQQNIPTSNVPVDFETGMPVAFQSYSEDVQLATDRAAEAQQNQLRRQLQRDRLRQERETRSIARRERNAEALNRRRAEIDPDNELIIPVLPAANDPTESEIEFHRNRLQGLQGFQNEVISIPDIDSGDFRLSGSESDSTGSNEFLLGIGYAETPTRPNTPNPNPTPLQGVGMDIIQERDYFDTSNF